MSAIRPKPSVANASPTPPASRASPFEEGVPYVGQSQITVTRNGPKHTVELPLQFAGASLWSAADKASSPTPELITKADSIADNPALKERVLEVCDAIEDAWTTPEIELKIVPSFVPRESAIIDSILEEGDLIDLPPQKQVSEKSAALWNGLEEAREPNDPIAVIVTPIINQSVITPTLWDVTAPPDLLAHEVGHLLGNMMEGYSVEAYPLTGIMRDETAFDALKKLGIRPHPTHEDTNTVLASVIARGTTPALPVSVEEATKMLQPNNDALFASPFVDWHNLSLPERRAYIDEKVAEWKKENPSA